MGKRKDDQPLSNFEKILEGLSKLNTVVERQEIQGKMIEEIGQQQNEIGGLIAHITTTDSEEVKKELIEKALKLQEEKNLKLTNLLNFSSETNKMLSGDEKSEKKD